MLVGVAGLLEVTELSGHTGRTKGVADLAVTVSGSSRSTDTGALDTVATVGTEIVLTEALSAVIADLSGRSTDTTSVRLTESGLSADTSAVSTV